MLKASPCSHRSQLPTRCTDVNKIKHILSFADSRITESSNPTADALPLPAQCGNYDPHPCPDWKPIAAIAFLNSIGL